MAPSIHWWWTRSLLLLQRQDSHTRSPLVPWTSWCFATTLKLLRNIKPLSQFSHAILACAGFYNAALSPSAKTSSVLAAQVSCCLGAILNLRFIYVNLGITIMSFGFAPGEGRAPGAASRHPLASAFNSCLLWISPSHLFGGLTEHRVFTTSLGNQDKCRMKK